MDNPLYHIQSTTLFKIIFPVFSKIHSEKKLIFTNPSITPKDVILRLNSGLQFAPLIYRIYNFRVKEFKHKYQFGADDEFQVTEVYLQAVFEEYPHLKVFYTAMRNIQNSDKATWIETAYDIRDNDISEATLAMAEHDPDYPAKSKYMWAAAIADNPYIRLEDKQELVEIIYQEKKES